MSEPGCLKNIPLPVIDYADGRRELLLCVGSIYAAPDQFSMLKIYGMDLRAAHFVPEQQRWDDCLCSLEALEELFRQVAEGQPPPFTFDLSISRAGLLVLNRILSQQRGVAPPLLSLTAADWLTRLTPDELQSLTVRLGCFLAGLPKPGMPAPSVEPPTPPSPSHAHRHSGLFYLLEAGQGAFVTVHEL